LGIGCGELSCSESSRSSSGHLAGYVSPHPLFAPRTEQGMTRKVRAGGKHPITISHCGICGIVVCMATTSEGVTTVAVPAVNGITLVGHYRERTAALRDRARAWISGCLVWRRSSQSGRVAERHLHPAGIKAAWARCLSAAPWRNLAVASDKARRGCSGRPAGTPPSAQPRPYPLRPAPKERPEREQWPDTK
jgi:hypothetical protein